MGQYERPQGSEGFPYFQDGLFSAYAINRPGHPLSGTIVPCYEGIAVTWTGNDYYFMAGIPLPELISGRVCEVGAGLSPFATQVPGITVFEPFSYGELSGFLESLLHQRDMNFAQSSALSLAQKAARYAFLIESGQITHVQAHVEDVGDSYKGQFDEIIAINVLRNIPNRVQMKRVARAINGLGARDADYYVLDFRR